MNKILLEAKDFKNTLKPSHLYVIPIGGCGVFGMNMTCYIFNGKMIIVDAGSLFPDPWMVGISVVIPDPDFWLFSHFELLAYFVTHAHEDHIGALPFLIRHKPAPIYTTEWTSEIIKRKMMDQFVDADIISVTGETTVDLAPFSVSFLPIGHSIPDAVCFLVDAGPYRAFHSGDFKFDQADGEIPLSLNAMASRPLDLFLCDSTNADKDGICPQEITVYEPLKKLIREAKGNIYIASFSSNLMRFKWVVDICRELRRKLYLSGTSIKNNFELAKKLGMVTDGEYFDETEAPNPLKNAVVIISGCQGEFRSSLARLATNEHRFFQIRDDDQVVFSARTIPGNEKNIAEIIDKLRRLDAKIVTTKDNPGIHVSGHCYGGEVTKLLEYAKPTTFIPVHGTHGQQLANALRNPSDHTLIVENGDIIEQGPSPAEIIGRIRVENVYVDEDYKMLLRRTELLERLRIAKKGIAFLSGAISGKKRKWFRGPSIKIFGLVRDDQWVNEIHTSLINLLKSDDFNKNNNQEFILNTVKSFWDNALIQRFGRRPITHTEISLID